MKTENVNIWDETGNPEVMLHVYIPEKKVTDAAVLIFAGGAYLRRADYEGEGYAKFLNENGITAFVCDYRVFPNVFPSPLWDAMRSVQYIRYNNEKYLINKDKIYVMGSSAGGHLAAVLSTYNGACEYEAEDAIKDECYRPNGQILCYAAIKGRTFNLDIFKDNNDNQKKEYNPDLCVGEKTPKAFIWQTFGDSVVSVDNSLDYALELKKAGVSAEIHIYPEGDHGLGLAENTGYTGDWAKKLVNWIIYNDKIKQ